MQWETATPVGFPVCTRHNDCRLKKTAEWRFKAEVNRQVACHTLSEWEGDLLYISGCACPCVVSALACGLVAVARAWRGVLSRDGAEMPYGFCQGLGAGAGGCRSSPGPLLCPCHTLRSTTRSHSAIFLGGGGVWCSTAVRLHAPPPPPEPIQTKTE